MTKNLSLVTLTLSLAFSAPTFATSLRDDSQDVFTKPKVSGMTQILLGLVELGIGTTVWPKMEAEEESLEAAKKSLAEADRLPTTPAQKRALIKEIMVNSASYEGDVRTGKPSDLNDEARTKFARVKAMDIVDDAEKARQIAAAQGRVASATESVMQAAQNRGFIHKSVRIVRAGTSIILIGDVLARIYIWNVLDANPTFSPVATLTGEVIKNVLK